MIGQLCGQLVQIFEESNQYIAIINANGVGYMVHIHARLYNELIHKIGDYIALVIDTYVREDQLKLYGFDSYSERAFFKTLTSVQGLGNKGALSLLSIGKTQDLQHAILSDDKAFVTQADGIGPKLASRIVTDMQDKIGTIPVFLQDKPTMILPTLPAAESAAPAPQTDATSLITADNDTENNVIPGPTPAPKPAPATIKKTVAAANNPDPDEASTSTDSSVTDYQVCQDAASALVNLGFHKHDAYRVVADIQKQDNSQSMETLLTKALQQMTHDH